MGVETIRSIKQVWDNRGSTKVASRFYTGGGNPQTTTTGTNVTPVSGTVYVSELFIPTRMRLTGIAYSIGTVGGTDKAIAILWDAAGNAVAYSATAGTTVGTAATFQSLDFTSTVNVYGPALYYAGVMVNGTTCRLRTHAAGAHFTKSATGTFGTIPTLTVPTSFSADTGIIACTY